MELDFTSDVVEKLVLRRALTDKEWLGTLSGVFDRRWFKTRYLSTTLSLVLRFYDKYGKAPSAPVVAAMAKKYAEHHPEDQFSEAGANALVQEALASGLDVDDEVVGANIREFVRKNAFSASLMDSIDLLSGADSERDSEKYRQIVDSCLEKFDRVQRMAFGDSDLGLDYFDKA